MKNKINYFLKNSIFSVYNRIYLLIFFSLLTIVLKFFLKENVINFEVLFLLNIFICSILNKWMIKNHFITLGSENTRNNFYSYFKNISYSELKEALEEEIIEYFGDPFSIDERRENKYIVYTVKQGLFYAKKNLVFHFNRGKLYSIYSEIKLEKIEPKKIFNEKVYCYGLDSEEINQTIEKDIFKEISYLDTMIMNIFLFVTIVIYSLFKVVTLMTTLK